MKSNELKEIIARAKRVINSKINIEECRNIEISKGFMTVSDNETTYSQIVEISENIDICINFEELDKLSRKLKNNVPVSFKQQKDELTISYKASEFKYTDANTGKISELNKSKGLQFVDSKLLTPETIKILKTASKYVSTDDLRPVLNGVLIDKTNHVVATDTQIMYYPLVQHDIKHDIIIATKLIKALSDRHYLLEYVINDNEIEYIRLSNENEIFVHRCMPGKYPNWRCVIPENLLSKTTINNKQLIEIVDLASLTSNKLTKLIKLNLSEITEISSKDIDYNKESAHIIEAEHSGETMTIGLKSSYLMKILKEIKTDNIDIQVKSNTSGIIINDNYLLMPTEL